MTKIKNLLPISVAWQTGMVNDMFINVRSGMEIDSLGNLNSVRLDDGVRVLETLAIITEQGWVLTRHGARFILNRRYSIAYNAKTPAMLERIRDGEVTAWAAIGGRYDNGIIVDQKPETGTGSLIILPGNAIAA
jgi:hypothetical protein